MALAIILGTTLRAAPSQVAQVAETSWRCVVCGDAGATDVLLNLVLFFPLGIALRLLGWSWTRALVAMALLTMGIETAQGAFLAGRDASLGDVLANTLGGAIGFRSVPSVRRLRAPSVRRARVVGGMLLCCAMGVWVATGWGLHPEGSDATPWVGQPVHRWPGHDPFPGSLDAAYLNGMAVPNDPLSSRPVLEQGVGLDLRLTRRDPRTPKRPVSVLRIVDAHGRAQLDVTQRGEDLFVGVRTRTFTWRVRTPAWRFDNAMAMVRDVPWRIEWGWRTDRIELRAGPLDGSVPPLRIIPLSVGLGWAFVHPFAAPIGPPLTDGWTILWLALWGVPLGWCFGWLARGERLLGGAITLASYASASMITGLPVREWECAMLALSLAAGMLAAARSAARGRT